MRHTVDTASKKPSARGRYLAERGRAVCLFAQFAKTDALPAYVFRYFEALCSAGYTVHAALSGRTRVSDADQARLAALGVHAHPRPNAGLDFGAWAELIERGCADGADEILLANDSVLGPFAPLAPIRRAMAGYDAWGMVLSREGRPHLQSWFVAMTADAFARPAVRRVFAQDFQAMSKPEIIVHGEFGLAAAFETEGLDVGAVHRSALRLRPSALLPTNPMHFRWRQLLDEGVPFLKLELLRRNPARIIGAAGWRAALVRAGFDPSWGCLMEEETPPAHLRGRQFLWQLATREGRPGILLDRLRGR